LLSFGVAVITRESAFGGRPRDLLFAFTGAPSFAFYAKGGSL
jgi:hypothetical protein